jgi:hypothetical protein
VNNRSSDVFDLPKAKAMGGLVKMEKMQQNSTPTGPRCFLILWQPNFSHSSGHSGRASVVLSAQTSRKPFHLFLSSARRFSSLATSHLKSLCRWLRGKARSGLAETAFHGISPLPF